MKMCKWILITQKHVKISMFMKNNQSLEDYLERILILRQKLGNVRSIDIVHDMNFSKPSISIAMKKLEEKGLVAVDEITGFLTLTNEGERIARNTYEKHCLLRDFFISIGVNEEVAAEDACKIEHDLSDETFTQLRRFIKKQ